MRFHDLRHVAQVFAAEAGATLPELMARLGQATPAAALIYLHARAERDHAPAADLLPALLVANARVDAASSAGRRSLPLDEFLVDRKRTALAPNELVTSISLDTSRIAPQLVINFITSFMRLETFDR